MKKIIYILFFICTITFAHTYHGVSMAPNTLKGWVVTSDTGWVFYTPDCGLSWISQCFLTSRYFRDIFFLNEQKGWICTDQGFVYHTEDGGIIWTNQVMGLSKNSFRISFLDDNCGWVGCRSAIIGRTISGGQDWQQIWLPYPPFHVDTVDIWGLSFANRQKGWFCSGRFLKYIESLPGQGDTWFRKGQGFIGVSNDSGINWQLLLRDTINDFYDIKMMDSLNGFVVGGNDRTMSATVMKTQNGGVTWQTLSIPSQAHYLRSLKIIGNKIWVVGHSGTILHSDGGGINWVLQTCPIDTTLYDIDFSDSIHGLIAGDGAVLYTHDGGNSWHIVNLGIDERIAVPFGSAMTMTLYVKVYPNPVKSLTAILYTLSAEGKVSLQLYDILGRLIKTLVNENKKAGNYSLTLNSKTLSAGVYFLALETSNKKIIERFVIIK